MPDLADDDAALAVYAMALADAVDDVLALWVMRSVARIAEAWSAGVSPGGGWDTVGLDEPGLRALRAEAAQAGLAALADVAPRVRALLVTDVDAQRTGPLALLREAVPYPTEVLERAGVPPVARDEFAVRAFPSDRYGLSPAAFGDIDPSLHEPGLVWGAAKAHVVLARRRAEGHR